MLIIIIIISQWQTNNNNKKNVFQTVVFNLRTSVLSKQGSNLHYLTYQKRLCADSIMLSLKTTLSDTLCERKAGVINLLLSSLT